VRRDRVPARFVMLAIALAAVIVPSRALAQLLHRPLEGDANEPPPRDPYVFVANGKLGVEPSVRTIDSLGRLVFHYEDVLPFGGQPERGFVPKVLGVTGRALELLFLDQPIAELTVVAAHEIAGHGGRGRELGLEPTFLFNVPGIYRLLFASSEGDGAGGYTSYHTHVPIEDMKESVSVLGGVEANYVHAWWINARIVHQRGWVHHGDLLTYGWSKLTYAQTYLATGSLERMGARSSNDIESYVTILQQLSNGWRAEDRRRIARRLTAGHLWNLVDPTLLYSVYGVAVASLYHGERTSRMPLPSIGKWVVYPSPRYGLTPFGAEQGLDVFVSPEKGGALLDVYARIGTSGLASYWGAGLRLLDSHVLSRHVPLGIELDVWRQPELVIEERGLFDRPGRMGVNAGIFADFRLIGGQHARDPRLGISTKLAAKTPGHVPGQPLAGGAHGYVGLSVHW